MASLEYLLNRYANKTCTPEEKETLMQMLQDSGNDEAVQQLLDKMIIERPEKHTMPETTAQAVLQAIFEAEDAPVVPIETGRVRRLSFNRIAAAAVVLVMITAAGWWALNRTTDTSIAATETMKNDVKPGGNKALLTLADGSTIVLDNAANGIVAQEGNANVVKLKNGQLRYEKGSASATAALAYNTLSTPKGGEYTITLPDGSKVWLNAASSITYPTSFDAKERKVQVTGEAYFEVARLVTVQTGKRVPFVVDIKNKATGNAMGQVEVLGTHFNINAYDDERSVKTTLLEGKVKFINTQVVQSATIKEAASAILKPGEQAVIRGGAAKENKAANDAVLVRQVNVNDVMAWRNGLFHFENADIKTVMRQLSRWYDVEVVYKKNIDDADPLFFEITRNTNLSDVLKALNLTGSAEFRIDNNKLIIE